MGETGFVPHGFQASLRDCCGERAPFPRGVVEAALAHIIGHSVERAHHRGDVRNYNNLFAARTNVIKLNI